MQRPDAQTPRLINSQPQRASARHLEALFLLLPSCPGRFDPEVRLIPAGASEMAAAATWLTSFQIPLGYDACV